MLYQRDEFKKYEIFKFLNKLNKNKMNLLKIENFNQWKLVNKYIFSSYYLENI